eukprot:scaffold5872_cov104-Isochrysis_galbana.AAC.8
MYVAAHLPSHLHKLRNDCDVILGAWVQRVPPKPPPLRRRGSRHALHLAGRPRPLAPARPPPQPHPAFAPRPRRRRQSRCVRGSAGSWRACAAPNRAVHQTKGQAPPSRNARRGQPPAGQAPAGNRCPQVEATSRSCCRCRAQPLPFLAAVAGTSRPAVARVWPAVAGRRPSYRG